MIESNFLDNSRIDSIKELPSIQRSQFNDAFETKIGSTDLVYGDVFEFTINLIPGVSEYKAIKAGDWAGLATSLAFDFALFVALPAGITAIAGTEVVSEIGEVAAKKIAIETLEAVVDKSVSKYSAEISQAAISNPAQLKVLESLDLTEMIVNDKRALLNNTIDYDLKSMRIVDGVEVQTTNLERMKLGLAPLGVDAKPIELHHIGQKMDSPLAQLTQATHRGNFSQLHETAMPSQIDRKLFKQEKAAHWKTCAKIVNGEI